MTMYVVRLVDSLFKLSVIARRNDEVIYRARLPRCDNYRDLQRRTHVPLNIVEVDFENQFFCLFDFAHHDKSNYEIVFFIFLLPLDTWSK